MMYLLLYFLQSGARVDEVEDPVGPALSQAAHLQLHLLQTRQSAPVSEGLKNTHTVIWRPMWTSTQTHKNMAE